MDAGLGPRAAETMQKIRCSAMSVLRHAPCFAAALLRMRYLAMALNVPHPERERSEQSKDA